MDGEPKLCNVEHVSEDTDEKGASLLPPPPPLALHSDLRFKTLLRLFSFRQGPVSLRNTSERATAGWWARMLKLPVGRILGQKRSLLMSACTGLSLLIWNITSSLRDFLSTLHKCQTALKEEPTRWLVLFHPWNAFRSCLKSYSLEELKPAGMRGSMWPNPEFTSRLINRFIISYTAIVSLPGVDAGGVLLTVLPFCAGTPVSYNDALKQEPPGPVQGPFTFLWSALN